MKDVVYAKIMLIVYLMIANALFRINFVIKNVPVIA